MKIHVIGDRDTVIGFRLLGIDGTVIDNIDSEESITQIKDVIKEFQKMDHGLIIINEKIADKFEKIILPIRMGNENIIFIEIPDRFGTKKPQLSLNYIMKKVVGMKI